MAGEVVKQVHHIARDGRVGGEEPDIRLEPSCAQMIVSRANVRGFAERTSVFERGAQMICDVLTKNRGSSC
jgi:hypothetical protein